MRYVVGRISEIPPGHRKIVYPVGQPGIGVFNVGGKFHALKNVCPHQGAPLCLGAITGTTEAHSRGSQRWSMSWGREGQFITCPWHRWEFEIATGRTVFPSRDRVATYAVTVGDDVDRRRLAGVETFPVAVDDDVISIELHKSRARRAG